MSIFATTEHLNLRAYCQDRDLAHILDLWNDPLVQITGSSEYPRPHTQKWALDVLAPQLDTALLAIIIEQREELDGSSVNGTANDEEESSFVGYALLQLDHRRNSNRDAVLAIALSPRWWGRGYGTQAAKWMVDHAFRALGMHRVSLAVLDTNKRAISLYKRIGFVEEGRRRECAWRDGKWVDHISMGMLDREWRSLYNPDGHGT